MKGMKINQRGRVHGRQIKSNGYCILSTYSRKTKTLATIFSLEVKENIFFVKNSTINHTCH